MKKLILCLAIIFMILISGCITLSTDSKVNKNGEIEKYNVKIKTNTLIYSMLNEMCQKQDNKSLKESFTSQGGDYSEVWDGNNVTMVINGAKHTNVTVEKNESFIIYRDKFGHFANNNKEESENENNSMSNAMDSAIKINYYLEMPYKIIDSNADSVKDNKAEWHMFNSSSIRDMYAKCDIPSSSLPDIGILSSICIILITILILNRGKL